MINNLNKNISVWRGENTPPTDYHLWIKESGDTYIKIGEQWLPLAEVDNKSDIANIKREVSKLKETTASIKLVENNQKPANILKSYSLSVDGLTKGINIDIPNDSFLVDVKLGYSNAFIDESTGLINIGVGDDPLFLLYSIVKADGSYTLIKIDLTKFITEKEYSDGLEVVNNKLKVKIAEDSDPLLVLTKEGIKLSGVNNSLNGLNTSVKEVLKNLMKLCAKVQLNASPLLILKGLNTNISLSWKFLFNGEELAIDSMELQSNGVTLESKKTSYTDIINDTKTYKVIAIPDGSTTIESNSVTVTAVYPQYYYAGTDTFDASLAIQARKIISISPSSSATITFASPLYLWLCVPQPMTITKVVSSGFDVPMDAVIVKSIDNVKYNCYRSTDTINTGTVNFTIYGSK